jgi:hypothetical protein
MSSASRSSSTERALVKPQPLDIPWSPVPTSVTVSSADTDQSIALWDRFMSDGDTDYSGLLEAEVVD